MTRKNGSKNITTKASKKGAPYVFWDASDLSNFLMASFVLLAASTGMVGGVDCPYES